MFIFLALSIVLLMVFLFVFFCKQKTAYEMRISDWSSDVCSSDLSPVRRLVPGVGRQFCLAQPWHESDCAAELSRKSVSGHLCKKRSGICRRPCRASRHQRHWRPEPDCMFR